MIHKLEDGDEELSARLESNKLISKEALGRLDQLPLSGWHILVTMALGLVWIFDGFEVSLVSLMRQKIVLSYSQATYGILISSYQVGCICGSFVFGMAAHMFGRRSVFLITLALYFVGVILSGITTGAFLFALSRFLTGLSVGGQFTAIFTAVDEFLPPTHRGRVNIGIDGTWHLGGSIAAALTIALGDIDQWRLLFLAGALGVIALILLRQNVPQSPRWLLIKGRVKEALAVITVIEQAVRLKQLTLRKIERHEEDGKVQNHQVRAYLREILRVLKMAIFEHTTKLGVSVALMYSQAFFFNLIYYQYPQKLASMGMNQRQVGLYMLPLSLVSFVSTLAVGPFFDIIGRKKMLLITYCGSGIMLLISETLTDITTIEVFICTMFFLSSPAGSAANLIASEVFPTAARTIMLFLLFIVSMLGGICGVWLHYPILSSCLMIGAGLLAFWKCPPAENKTLEEVEFM